METLGSVRWLWVALVGASLALASCVVAPPPELGSPTQSALVIFDGSAHTTGVFGEDRVMNATAAQVRGGRKSIYSKPFGRHVLFPDLPPGRYVLTAMQTEELTNQRKVTFTFRFSPQEMEEVQGLSFDVAAGEVRYIGRAKVVYETSFLKPPSKVGVTVEPDPARERAVLEALDASELPPESPWRARIKARLQQLPAGG